VIPFDTVSGTRWFMNKEFDAVRMMREIRDKLSKIYSKDPEAQTRDLQEIRARHGIKVRRQKAHCG
jgi:hypothetical protein